MEEIPPGRAAASPDAGSPGRASWRRTRSASRRITSLYFDTPGRALIERSLDKPLYKEKLRLRRYGEAAGEDADEDGCVFVEIKKKYKGVVYKRRVGMSLAAARAYMGGMPYEQACACFPLSDPALAAASVSAAQPADRARDRFVRVRATARCGPPWSSRATARPTHRSTPTTASCASRSTRALAYRDRFDAPCAHLARCWGRMRPSWR